MHVPPNAVPNEPSPPPLGYGRAPALARLRRWRFRLGLLALACMGAILVQRHREALTQRATWLYWSRRCATHEMPGPIELVVTNPERARHLLATDPDYVRQPPPQGFPTLPPPPPGPVALYSPRAWRTLAQVDGRCEWLAMRRPDEEPIAFLGTRRRPDGIPRLVVLGGSGTNAYDLLAGVSLLVLPHPKWNEPLPGGSGTARSWYSGRWSPATVRGAVADPDDPAHIIIEFVAYEAPFFDSDGTVPPPKAGVTGVIDAYLQNDDSLSFSLREAPGLRRLGVKLGRTSMNGIVPPAGAFRANR